MLRHFCFLGQHDQSLPRFAQKVVEVTRGLLWPLVLKKQTATLSHAKFQCAVWLARPLVVLLGGKYNW